ncbi:aminodeoxychorismate synthase component I [Sphingomicrobium clamense]|uniref:Aminodeoxychorismate synthase component I n=1 Tax=Sphingomicrobium clamense TaxID=2851013 RepID=A0ABS6V8D0_9SPHN|nr:aminodeoxychorismate synthase component I [Sphingomicrobium sp. B8]MBW0145842.1 aminodeoxychorismate synthase component I [Sphingomicrobium sp. B8]
MDAPFCLFDDARPDSEAGALLFESPREVVVAERLGQVRPALERLRTALAEGNYAAGYLGYEAGHALDPALEASARQGDRPLLWFGLFDAPQRLSKADIEDLLSDREGRVASPVPRIAEAKYVAAVERVREALFAGDYYQANLTFQNDVAVGGSALGLYRALRSHGTGGWGGVLATESYELISVSPEQFFKVENGCLSAKPMKGTAPRGESPEIDRKLAKELAADEKQRAENLMIVDLLRNDMARVAVPGTVRVPKLFAVETYPTVHQMVSEIEAELAPGMTAVDAIEKLFPCGSVTGAPKIAAIKALRELEPEPRGAYTGSMGWMSPNGDAAFNVMIRTLERVAGSSQARLGLGSGLVVDSVPRHEWAECRLKGKFVEDAASEFDLIETMRYDPEEGIIALEAHLLRMKEAAAALGFAYDRHDARNELQAATFGKPDVSLVRLLASRTGAMAIEVRPLGDPPTEPVSVEVVPMEVEPGDFRLDYKTTDRAFYDDPRKTSEAHEVVFERADGTITEGSRSSVFVERDGTLVTPPRSAGLMPGVFRQGMIDEGKAVEGDVTRADLANGFFIGSSARGLLAARLV